MRFEGGGGAERRGMKRARSGVEGEGQRKRGKVLRRYGSGAGRDVFEGWGEGEGERVLGSSWGVSTPRTVALEHPRSMRAGKDQLDLSDMPPPASKSISQTQASEAGAEATMRSGVHTDSAPVEPNTADTARSFESTSSDSRMPDPTMSSRSRGSGEDVQDRNSMEDAGNFPKVNRDATTLETGEPSSSASLLSPSKTIIAEKGDPVVARIPENDSECDDEHSVVLPKHHTIDTVKPVVLLPDLSHEIEITDELSLPSHGPDTWSINQTTISKARKRKNEEIQADEPGSDDISIGLPKDQYQPRPSRSRSGRGTEEVLVPTDFSKRPEAIVKKKGRAKRSKTTAFHELRPKDEDDEEDDPIAYKPTMEAIEEIPTKKLEDRKDPAITENCDEPVMDAEPELEQDSKPVEKPTGKKKGRGRPRKEATEAPEDTGLGDTETNAPPNHTEQENPKDPVPAKKPKRGAKAKKAPAVAISEELVQDSEEELDDLDKMIRDSNNILRETQRSNTTSSISVEKVAPSTSPTKGNDPSPAKAIETPPETPRKADTPTQKGPDKHSPISSGKVAYRVGLSKRARIAPLLRIVRKA